MSAEDENDFIILNPKTGLVYNLNQLAKEVWECAKEWREVHEIVDAIHSKYEVEHRTIQKDVTEYIKKYATILFEVVDSHHVQKNK